MESYRWRMQINDGVHGAFNGGVGIEEIREQLETAIEYQLSQRNPQGKEEPGAGEAEDQEGRHAQAPDDL